MSSDIEMLEALHARMGRQAAESAAYTPGLAGLFHAVAITIKRALNARIAAELGLAKPRDAVMEAHRALVALDNLNERRRLSRPDAVKEHTAEYSALCRLAGLPEEE